MAKVKLKNAGFKFTGQEFYKRERYNICAFSWVDVSASLFYSSKSTTNCNINYINCIGHFTKRNAHLKPYLHNGWASYKPSCHNNFTCKWTQYEDTWKNCIEHLNRSVWKIRKLTSFCLQNMIFCHNVHETCICLLWAHQVSDEMSPVCIYI